MQLFLSLEHSEAIVGLLLAQGEGENSRLVEQSEHKQQLAIKLTILDGCGLWQPKQLQ